MAAWWLAIAGIATLLGIFLFVLAPRLKRAIIESTFAKARKEFRARREHLEAKFFELAAETGKPRGLEWTTCEFEDDVTYARDRSTGDFVAFVSVTIRFAATAGGGMEHVQAVSNLRAATAVFHYTSGCWHTEGRAIFNLEPEEAIRHFQNSLEMVAHDLATR